MIRLRCAGLAAVALLLIGCAGDEAVPARVEEPARTFEPHRIVADGDRLLVVGVSAADDRDDPCSGHRDLAVVEVDRYGDPGDVTTFPAEDFGERDCVETIETAFLDRGALLISGWATIAEPEYGGSDRFPYAVRLRPGEGPEDGFGEDGFLALPHPTAGLVPFGEHLLYAGGVRFDRSGREILDEFAFPYGGANGRVAPLPGERVAVVLFDEASPSYHARIVSRDKVGPKTSVVVGRSTNYAEVTHLVPAAERFFVLLESDTEIEVVHRHLADGRPDRSFGRGGRVDVQSTRGRLGAVTGIAAAPDGGLVSVGDLQEAGRRKAFAVRFDQRGRRLGSTVVDLAPAAENGDTWGFAAAAVRDDGSIMLAVALQGLEARLFQLRPDGRVDRAFGEGGSVALTLR